MSGEHVPYQLRTNKFVERQLFLDALDFVRVWNGPTKYVYVSMGGPFLEDFKEVNRRLSIEAMISIEQDVLVWERQKFNCPFGFVQCLNETADQLITGFERFTSEFNDSKFIVWLDYADSNQRRVQLQEFETLVGKLVRGDVAKITLNANPESKLIRSEYSKLTNPQYFRLVADDLIETLGEYVPEGGVDKNKLREKDFAKLLARCVGLACRNASENSEFKVVPIISSTYKDGTHQMLTVTALVVDQSLEAVYEADAQFNRWEFRSGDWDQTHNIRVPHLSTRERMVVNQLLKTTPDAHSIHNELGVRFDEHDGASIAVLRSYLEHYRRYPSFASVNH